jgi:hypothetical protein
MPGRVGQVPGEALSVLAAFEDGGAKAVADLPQLAATLAASHTRLEAACNDAAPRAGILRRVAGKLRS